MSDDRRFGNTFDDVQIQAAIDFAHTNNIYNIIIGGNYTVKTPIDPYTDQTIIVNGTISAIYNTRYPLAQNEGLVTATLRDGYYIIDDSSFAVTNSTGLKTGQWVSVSCDDGVEQGGGTWHTNKMAHIAKIHSIVGNIVTMNWLFDNYATSKVTGDNMFLTSQNAKIIPCPAIFLLYNDSNITITGNGTLNGNRPYDGGVDTINSLNFEGIRKYNLKGILSRAEDLSSACPVSINYCYNININNLKIKKGLLHNIVVNYSNKITIDNCYIYDAHDKGILAYSSTDLTIKNNYVGYSLFEDGINCYAYNEMVLLDNNYIERCGRYGICFNMTNRNCYTSNNTCKFNEGNMTVVMYDGFISNNDHLIGGRYGTHRTASSIVIGISLSVRGNNHAFNNLTIDYPNTMCTTTYTERDNWFPLYIGGNDGYLDTVNHIVFNGGQINNIWVRVRTQSTGAWISVPYNYTSNFIKFGYVTGGINYPVDDVTFNGMSFDGIGDGMYFYNDGGNHRSENIKFIDCTFKNLYYNRKFANGTTEQDSLTVKFIND